MTPEPTLAKRPGFGLPVQLAFLIAVCALVYWFRLGSGGFFGTEAHRAVPAYEMLEHGHWLVPRMFDQPYLRKPPGMPWAIAGMSSVLGESVFAARAVSALASTLMAVVAFGTAKRWFGARAALPAGLAQALMPVLWETGRAAEIEPLNHLGTQIAALLLIDALVFARTKQGRVVSASVAAIGIIWFALAKGPASVPVIVATISAICIVTKSWKPLAGVLWISLAISGVVIAGFGWLIAQAAGQEVRAPVVQSPGEFLFEPGMILGILTLPFVSFAQMLPASFGLLFPWGEDAKQEVGRDGWPERSMRIARTLAVAWFIAVGLYMVFGVRNPRYTLPAAVLLAPLAGAYLAGVGVWMTESRCRIGRLMVLGRGAALGVVLIAGAVLYQFTIEANRRATSATQTGMAIASELDILFSENPNLLPATIVANDVIEARPELALAIEHTLRELGHDVRVVWVPDLADQLADQYSDGALIALLRVDGGSTESVLIDRYSLIPMGTRWAEWPFHKYLAALYLVNDRD